jgi:hypothetical protein
MRTPPSTTSSRGMIQPTFVDTVTWHAMAMAPPRSHPIPIPHTRAHGGVPHPTSLGSFVVLCDHSLERPQLAILPRIAILHPCSSIMRSRELRGLSRGVHRSPKTDKANAFQTFRAREPRSRVACRRVASGGWHTLVVDVRMYKCIDATSHRSKFSPALWTSMVGPCSRFAAAVARNARPWASPSLPKRACFPEASFFISTPIER